MNNNNTIKFYFLLAILALPLKSMAGEIYRCVDGEGSASYTQKTVAGQECQIVRKNVFPEPPKQVEFVSTGSVSPQKLDSNVSLRIPPPAVPPKGLPPLPSEVKPKP